MIGNVQNCYFALVILHIFEHCDLSWQLDVWRIMFFHCLNWSTKCTVHWFLYPGIVVFHFFFVIYCIYVIIWKNHKIHWETPVKMREALSYGYLQYFVTLWTEPHLDSQRFLCLLLLIFICYYCLIFPGFFWCFFVLTYSFWNEKSAKFIGIASEHETCHFVLVFAVFCNVVNPAASW